MLPPELLGSDKPLPPEKNRVADRWVWPVQKNYITVTFCDPKYHDGTYGKDLKGFWHTGIDLNVGGTTGNGDAGKPVFAAANGIVAYVAYKMAGGAGSTWGPMVVLQHDMPDGSTRYTRYAHLQNVKPKLGDFVSCETQIAEIGLPSKWGQKFLAHLHFNVMTRRPPPLGKLTHWPKRDGPITEVTSSYQDGATFLRAMKAKEPA